ncbi:hypothetical protein B296_00042648 [Ensete ventricosum]|uniref:Uncharacterized protein n=1 Tax=Ensete ventricosum TaxID=4639 RepID=A0A426ZEC0_ENSVE|nr:hypothetical protein B296_00042648 [Ensete ventricosum]
MEAGPAVAVPALTPVATSASLAATAHAVSSNTAVATTTSVATASAIATASAATKASSAAAASAILRFVDGDVPPVKVLAVHPLDGVPHRLLVPEGLLERAVVSGPGKTADETAELNIRSRHGKDRSRIVDRGGPGRESTRNPKSSPKSAFIDRAAGGCGDLTCRVFGFPCPCVWAVVSPSVGLPPRRALLLPRNKHIRLGGSQTILSQRWRSRGPKGVHVAVGSYENYLEVEVTVLPMALGLGISHTEIRSLMSWIHHHRIII